MDSRDRDAISDLFRKLREVERQAGPRDGEAERLIADEAQRLPGAPYYMAQTIVMQDMALNAKQREVDELKQRLDAAERRPTQSAGSNSEGGFLSRMFGSGSSPSSDDSRAAAPRGPWGAPSPSSPPPSYGQQQAPYGQPQGQYAPPPPPAYPQQGYAPQGGGFGRGMGGGGFLAGAAQTAMGVAGGVVLGNAIGSLFGGHHGGLFGGEQPTEVINETTNIYEGDRGGDVQQASDDGGWNNDQSQDDSYQDASYDDGGFDDSGSDDTI